MKHYATLDQICTRYRGLAKRAQNEHNPERTSIVSDAEFDVKTLTRVSNEIRAAKHSVTFRRHFVITRNATHCAESLRKKVGDVVKWQNEFVGHAPIAVIRVECVNGKYGMADVTAEFRNNNL